METCLEWKYLTTKEKEQAENSYMYFMQCAACEGDREDKKFYAKILKSRKFRLECLKTKTFIRQPDGYIFVDL